MKVHPRFHLSVEKEEGGAALRFASATEGNVGDAASAVAEAGFDELCALSEAPAELRERLRLGACFSNGWQSWSFGGELMMGERVKRARILSALNIYTDRPGPLPKRGETLSNFLVYFRAGDCYLVLVSRGAAQGPTPPVAFRVAADRRTLGIEILAEGAGFSVGQSVADIAVFFVEGYFAFKERLESLFGAQERFARLAFLGHAGGLVPGGYESWYNRYTKIDEAGIVRDIEAIPSNDNLINAYYLKRGKPTIFQIDDGWERAIGDWEPDPNKFPRAMRSVAGDIEARGMIPGIWIAPLLVSRSSSLYAEHPEWLLRDRRGAPVLAGWNPGWDGSFYCLDLSLAEVEEHIAEIFDRLIERWGYRYLKLDFLYAGFLRGKRREGGAAFEQYDRVMRRITSKTRDSRGRPLAYLGCGAPLEPSFRHFPLMRIGADTRETWDWPALRLLGYQGRPAARVNVGHTIGRALLDKSVFVSDPDVLFCRSVRIALTEKEKELIALVGFMLASQIMFSDDAETFGGPGEAEFTKRIIALFDELAGRRYGATAIGRDLYSIFSEDGAISGIVNLSDRRLAGMDPGGKRALVSHFVRNGACVSFEPHSISLFET